MKFLKALFSQKPAKTPTWNILPEAERPAPKKRAVYDEPTVAMDEPTVSMELENNPFLDDIALATIQLEADDIEADDPYRSYSWQLDPENDTRSLKSIPVGTKTEKARDGVFNPYDTGSMRRGWKK